MGVQAHAAPVNDITWTKDVDGLAMTKRQRRWVGYIRDQFLARQHGKEHAGKYEFKTFEGSLTTAFLALRVESGLKQDENTAAETFCRNSYLVFIGVRGGITVHNNSFGTSKEKPLKGKKARWALI